MNDYKYTHHIMKWPDFASIEKQYKAFQWCRENFGEPNTGRWGLYSTGFNFNSEQDYIYFLLRWK